MHFPFPAMPSFAVDPVAANATGRTEFEAFLRYEDVAMDGRLMPLALPPAMSGLWQAAIVNTPGSRNSIAKGVIPILTRLTLTSYDQPIRVDRPVRCRAGYELAHSKRGDDIRLFMNVWCEVSGIAGRIGPRAGGGGELAVAGLLFAEHTYTRPLAPPDQRRVTRLDAEGYPEIPSAVYEMPAPNSAQDMPAGAKWTDELAADSNEVVFTLDQTDSNQHVHSLTYIRIFLDAAQRRIAATGQSMKIRSREVDISYRKPCFAGDRVRAHLRLFELDGSPGAAGFVAGPDGKPRCYVRVLYSR